MSTNPPYITPETSTSLLEWRQNLIAQLYLTTTALSSYDLTPLEQEKLKDQGAGLQWCVLQQQMLSSSNSTTVTTHNTSSFFPSATASSSSSALSSLSFSPFLVEELPSFHSSLRPNPEERLMRTPRELAAVKVASSRLVWDSEVFYEKFHPLIEQLLTKSKAAVCNYRWKPKRDPGDVSKFTNLTRGKIDQLMGLAEYIAKVWNNLDSNSSSPPPFLIKPSLSFSARGHIFCDACKFTYVHLHKDYVKFIEHFTCVSHLARCRDLESEENAAAAVRAIGEHNHNSKPGGEEEQEEEDEEDEEEEDALSIDKTESCLHTFAHFVTSQSSEIEACHS